MKHSKIVFYIALVLQITICNKAYSGENESVYTVEVTIPEYDPDNSEHFLISTVSDWSHINDSDKRYFYVVPNVNYGTVTITADGTKSYKRYISLHNGNDTHPAKLTVDEQANVKIIFSDAHYWVVDRMSSINSTADDFCYTAKNHSQNIVFNRLHLTNFFSGIGIQGTLTPPYTDNITIQNSRLDPMSAAGIAADHVAIILTGEDWNVSRTLKNTRILNNEIRNCNDGIMTIARPELGYLTVDYPGTIIDCNHIYVDSDVYTDGAGNHDPNGFYAWTENAIDLKAGSSDPDNPMIITNNYFWGYRWTDKNGGGSGGAGTAAGGHYHVKNVIIENNVVFDSNRGIDFAATGGLPYSVENATISGNIIYNIGHSPTGDVEYGIYFYASKNLTFENNTIVGVDKHSRWFAHNNDEQGMTVSCNVIIDSYEMTGTRTSTTTVENNTFYNTALQYSGDGTSYTNASDANMADLTFTIDTYTNNPRKITLPGVVTTASSPHVHGCFATDLGQARYPKPFNGHIHVPTIVDLSWVPGDNAESHDLYFGKNNPPVFVQNQISASYDPGVLDVGTTYYWKIDEKNDFTTVEGAVWSFETDSVDIAVNSYFPEGTKMKRGFYILNYPNPFCFSTNIHFALPDDGHLTVKIFSLMGGEVEVIANTMYPAGSHTIAWNAQGTGKRNVSVGGQMYLLKAQFEDQVITRKMVLTE